MARMQGVTKSSKVSQLWGNCVGPDRSAGYWGIQPNRGEELMRAKAHHFDIYYRGGSPKTNWYHQFII